MSQNANDNANIWHSNIQNLCASLYDKESNMLVSNKTWRNELSKNIDKLIAAGYDSVQINATLHTDLKNYLERINKGFHIFKKNSDLINEKLQTETLVKWIWDNALTYKKPQPQPASKTPSNSSSRAPSGRAPSGSSNNQVFKPEYHQSNFQKTDDQPDYAALYNNVITATNNEKTQCQQKDQNRLVLIGNKIVKYKGDQKTVDVLKAYKQLAIDLASARDQQINSMIKFSSAMARLVPNKTPNLVTVAGQNYQMVPAIGKSIEDIDDVLLGIIDTLIKNA